MSTVLAPHREVQVLCEAGCREQPPSDTSSTTTSFVSLLLVLGMVAMLVGVTRNPIFVPPLPVPQVAIDPVQDPKGHSRQARMTQIKTRFEQAVVMLHAKEYEHAITALQRVLQLSPNLVDAHVNMGYALLGLERYQEAVSFFDKATTLRPYQSNAYWGLAVTLEEMGDLQGALGAMRTYIHLSPPEDPLVRKARAALGEWEYTLARGPLPKHEAEFMARKGKEWMDRNSPDVDMPKSKPPAPIRVTPVPAQ